MKILSTVGLGALLLAFGSSASLSQDDSALPKGFATTPVLKSAKTADGDPLKYPSEGSPEIVSVIGTLEPKGQTALHQHPVPVFVYILEGQLSVQIEGAEKREYKQGEAFLESVGKWHQAFNEGDQPTKLLVVFVAVEGKPTTQAKQ